MVSILRNRSSTCPPFHLCALDDDDEDQDQDQDDDNEDDDDDMMVVVNVF